jgi:hypothetical protein
MNQDKLVREQLILLLGGGNSHMGFEDVIADFPLQEINSKTPGVPYSPWHFLEHMRIAQWDILEFIRNPEHVSPDYPEGYRPRADELADEARWHRSVKGFKADLQELQNMVADPKTDLYGPIPHAREYTIFREILVVADHNGYHIGEIAMLRQVMNLWPADNRYLTG